MILLAYLQYLCMSPLTDEVSTWVIRIYATQPSNHAYQATTQINSPILSPWALVAASTPVTCITRNKPQNMNDPRRLLAVVKRYGVTYFAANLLDCGT
jgi:hypothetical protein